MVQALVNRAFSNSWTLLVASVSVRRPELGGFFKPNSSRLVPWKK